MSIQYLEIDSTYRNRNQFPNPGQFDVIIGQSGQKTKLSSLDPISTACPIITYIPSSSTLSYTGFGYIPQTNTNISSSIILSIPVSANISHISNYYKSLHINLYNTQAVVDMTATNLIGTIVVDTWDYLTTTLVNNTGNIFSPPFTVDPTTLVDQFRISFSTYLDVTVYNTVAGVKFLVCTDFTNGIVFIPSGVLSSEIYKNWYIYNETLNTYAIIYAYDGNNSCVSITQESSWSLNNTISLRQSLPISFSSFQIGCTQTSIILSTTSSVITEDYIGSFIRITQSGSNKEECRIIQRYSGFPNFIAVVNSPFITAPSVGDTYEILPFTRDSFTPFNYNGSMISQEVCYDVQLINLIIPNVDIEQGGRPSDYPYFYVELEQYGLGTQNTIYSNNPNSVRKLFRVPVSDISQPSVNSFLTFDRSVMIKTIKLNPFSNFKFGVYLENGEPWKPIIKDTKSPHFPNKYMSPS